VVRGQASLGEAARTLKRDTRRYAKRQWTWFAREEGVHWVSADLGDRPCPVAEVKKLIERTRIFDYPG
jgi:tRNA dimethylallyltransferase